MVLAVSGALRVILASIVGALIYSVTMLLLSLARLEPPPPKVEYGLWVLALLAAPFAVPFLVSIVFRSGVKLGVVVGLLTILLGSGFFLTAAQLAPVQVVGPEGLYSFIALTALYAIPLGLIGGAVGGFIGRPPIGVLEWVIVRVVAAVVAGALAYNVTWILVLIWPDPEKVLGSAWWLVYIIRPLIASTVVFLLSRAHIVKLGLAKGLGLIALAAVIGAFTILLGIGFNLPIYLLISQLIGGVSTTTFSADLVFSPVLIIIGVICVVIAVYITTKI